MIETHLLTIRLATHCDSLEGGGYGGSIESALPPSSPEVKCALIFSLNILYSSF